MLYFPDLQFFLKTKITKKERKKKFYMNFSQTGSFRFDRFGDHQCWLNAILTVERMLYKIFSLQP